MRLNNFKIIPIICIYFIFFSCNKDPIHKLIAGNDYRLWLKIDEDEFKRGVSTYYFFDRKGSFRYYRQYRKSTKLEILEMDDVVPIEKWKLLKNNKIEVSGMTYNIYEISQGMFVYGIKSANFSKQIKLKHSNRRLDD